MNALENRNAPVAHCGPVSLDTGSIYQQAAKTDHNLNIYSYPTISSFSPLPELASP